MLTSLPLRLLALALLISTIPLLQGCGESSGGSSSGSVVVDTNPPGAVLDASFGGGSGRVLLAAGVGAATAVAEDDNGNLVVAGIIEDIQTDQQIVVWRLLPDGTLDNNFGTGGIVSFDAAFSVNPDQDEVIGIAIDNVGRVIVAGTTYGTNGDRDIFVARFNSSGQFDPTFGTSGGIVFAGNDDTAIHDDFAADLAVDDSGRVIVIGNSRDAGTSAVGEVAVWRFLSIGLLDPAYGTDGLFLSGEDGDRGNAVLVDSTGAAFLAGSRGDSLALWLLTDDGALETGFGAGGLALISDGSGTLRPTAAVIYDPLSVLIVGTREISGEVDSMFATRVFGDGVLDSNFGDSGFLTYTTETGNSNGSGVAVATSGQSVISGMTTLEEDPGTSPAGAMWLLTPGGFLDTSLAGSGIVHLTGSSDDRTNAFDIIIDSQDRIVIVGSIDIGLGTDNPVIWRVP